MIDIPGITLPPTTPPQFQAKTVINILPPAIAGLPAGTLVNLTVIRQDGQGNFLVGSPKGNFTLATNLSLAEGNEIVLQITSAGITNNAVTTNTSSNQYLPNFQAKVLQVDGKDVAANQRITNSPPGLEAENFDAVRVVISPRANPSNNANAERAQVTSTAPQGDLINLSRGTITTAILVSPSPDAERFINIRNQNVENINARANFLVDDNVPENINNPGVQQAPKTPPSPPLQVAGTNIKPSDVLILRVLGVVVSEEKPQLKQTNANTAQNFSNVEDGAENFGKPVTNQPATQNLAPQTGQVRANLQNPAAQILQNGQVLPHPAVNNLAPPVQNNLPQTIQTSQVPQQTATQNSNNILQQNLPAPDSIPQNNTQPQSTATQQNFRQVALQSNPNLSQFSGVVIGKEASEYIIKTPLGTVKADIPQNINKGTELSFQLVAVNSSIKKEVMTPTQAVTRGIASSQLNLMQMIQILRTVDPAYADSIIKTIIPQPDRDFPMKLFNYLNAVYNGDAAAVLTREVRRILDQQKRPDLIKRIESDFSSFKQIATDSGSNWNAMSFPVFDGKELNFGVIYYRDYGEDKEDEKKIKRFVIEVNMTHLGGFQFDGFVREANKKRQLDLYIKTKTKINKEMADGINEIFIESAELLGITGHIQFQTVNDFEIKPMTGTEGENSIMA